MNKNKWSVVDHLPPAQIKFYEVMTMDILLYYVSEWWTTRIKNMRQTEKPEIKVFNVSGDLPQRMLQELGVHSEIEIAKPFTER